ncbi:MAG: anaerobic magnesium-protoporphyrin monomethyl ester cyclase [Candidatus Sumerlaeota bacterium]|nr:anaerobic magnesium-protoporphyrin monomethyl ester cyclase [Candidatus Sumerlaeota bacterium]
MAKIALLSLYDEFCIGMRYVASHMAKHGHPCTIINFKRYNKMEREAAPKDIEDGYLTQVCPRGEVYLDYSTDITPREEEILFEILSEGNFDFVGFSIPSYHAHVAHKYTKIIREKFGLPVIWGGVHATVAAEDCVKTADYVAVGEGEELFLELIQLLESGGNPAEAAIPGLWVRRPGQEPIRGESRMPPKELDDLPFPQYDPLNEYLIEDGRLYHNEPLVFSQLHWTYKMVTGRGCPYFCSFCVWSTIKRDMPETKKLRRRSPQNAIDEIIAVRKKNPQLMMIEFEDDIFTVQKDWLDEFAPLYKKHVGLPFWCYTYPAFVNDYNLEVLKDMGIAYITMGVQSGSDRINYEVFDRRTERKRVLAAMELIAKHDILANYDIITNNPYETDEDRMQTLTLLANIPGRFNLHMGKLAWFPGTTISVRAASEGKLRAADEDLYRFWNALYLMAQHRLATEEQLVEMTRNEELRKNPEVLWSILNRFADLSDLQREAEQLRSQTESLRAERDSFRAKYESLSGRRVVRVGTKVADSVKSIVGAAS